MKKGYFESYREIIPDYDIFNESLTVPLPVHLRINPLKGDPGRVVEGLERKGIRLKKSILTENTLYLAPDLKSPGNLLEYFLGTIHPQALTSCLPAIALRPEPGAYVLDMCASPGGKCTHMSQLMENRGLLVANEPFTGRRIALGNTLERLGVFNTVVSGYPAQEFPLRQRFDFILADVPCSGEGRFRQVKSGSRYEETAGKARLPDLQKKMILRGFDLLKVAGELLYSTCTYNPEENESVVNHLLSERDAELLPLPLPPFFEQGITGWEKERYDRRLEKAGRFYPHRVDSVGFFMARIGRRS
jgi:tRNA (cytosine49-C5)-methyltransferase